MADIEVRGGRIAIRFSNGQMKWTSVTVGSGMSQSDIANRINRAKRIITFDLKMAGNNDMAREAAAISASAAAAKTYRQLNPSASGRRAPVPAPRPRARTRSGRSRYSTRARTSRRARAPAAKGPEITSSWIEGQLAYTGRGNYRAKKAVSNCHSSRLFVARFLTRAAQRGVARTENQKAATIAVFRALRDASPQFKLLLSSLAAQQQGTAASKRAFPEFIALQGYLSQGKDLAQADPAILRSADLYIRYFLYSFAAKNASLSRYLAEISQLPLAKATLDKLQRAGGNLSAIKLALLGTMDADTITASLLYLRRWNLEHPSRGRGLKQDRIDVWKAPSVIPLPLVAAVVPRHTGARVAAKPPLATGMRPVIGVIGDSITAGGRYAATLQKLLQSKFRGARVVPYGISGQNLLRIAARFNRDILSNRLQFNTVIIQGGVNEIAKIPVNRAIKAIGDMIRAARKRGMAVILLGITPWAAYSGASSATRNRTHMINNWMETYVPKNFPGTIFVDMSALGEPMTRGSRYFRLRRQYDSGDGLHPNNAGRDLMAQLIAKAAYNITPTRASAQSELQKFASEQWRGLGGRIFLAVKSSRPGDVLSIMENLPGGWKSVETALRSLKRDDIERAYDKVFNDILKKDRDFLDFCRTGRNSKRLTSPAVMMSTGTRPPDRRLVALTIKKYINSRANQKDDLGVKFDKDMRGLLVSRMRESGSRLPENPTEDLKTLAAITLYRWRVANPSANANAWEGTRSPVPRRTSPPVREPPRETAPPRDTGGRRKTINI
ncbi:MAG: GDSL-type esterase/lipase family protein [Candidatus Micrarchaeota archaeon]